MQQLVNSDVLKFLSVGDDGFNANIDNRFNLYVKKEKEGYVIDIWVKDTLIDSLTLWNDDIDDAMEDYNE